MGQPQRDALHFLEEKKGKKQADGEGTGGGHSWAKMCMFSNRPYEGPAPALMYEDKPTFLSLVLFISLVPYIGGR